MMEKQSFTSLLNQLTHQYGVHQVFSDFLTLVICAFSHGRMEKQYLQTIEKYKKSEAYLYSKALAALVVEMTGDGSGMVDVLGTYFEQNLNRGNNGQFFTPQSVCDMIARMNLPMQPGARIADPACGSGRMLMAMAKFNRNATFYGADNDLNCAKMATINMCLNTMYGEIAWMGSLTNEFYGGWEINPTIKGFPSIKPIYKHESVIHMKLPEENNKTHFVSHQQLILDF
jgi:hypothetical protein